MTQRLPTPASSAPQAAGRAALRRAGRAACGALLLLLALDVASVIVTGSGSLLALGRGPVGVLGFALRLAALGLLLGLRLRGLAAPARPLAWPWLALLLLLLPALFEFHFAGGRLGGDGVSYYVYTRSLAKDFDLDFTNEYTAYGLVTRGDLAMPTKTGLRRSIFAVGPGLMGLPFFAVGEAAARVQALGGLDANLSGYGPCHRNATALGGLLYGFGALLFMHAWLRRHFRPATALGAVLLTWGATFLHWYMVQQPLSSHAPSAFVAALVVWLWDRESGARGPRGYALLGLAIGFGMCVRWQNGVLLVLPAMELAASAASLWRRGTPLPQPAESSSAVGGSGGAKPPRLNEEGPTPRTPLAATPGFAARALRRLLAARPRLAVRTDEQPQNAEGPTPRTPLAATPGFAARALRRLRAARSPLAVRTNEPTQPAAPALGYLTTCALALAVAAVTGALPQMAAWKVLYGEWLLRYPPHGAGFLRLDHPYVLQTLFSSRHGLLAWTPVFWAGYLGFLPLWRRLPQLALPLSLPLVLMTYVNMCSGDWWAGGSFSNRRFDSLLPVFAPAFAAALDAACGFARRHATLALAAAGAPLVAWNLALAAQTDRGLVPRDDTVEFPRLAGNAWRVMAEGLGSPNTWPASWLFALRHGRPPSQYDVLVGRYLFYRQNNLGGLVEIGAPGDDAMLGEGWARIETQEGVGFRRARGRARVFAPLDVPEALDLRVRAQAPGGPLGVRVRVNGRDAGVFVATVDWSEGRVIAPAALWRRELNEVELDAGGGELRVDRLTFVRQEVR